MKIPFYDLKRENLKHKVKLKKSILSVVDSGHYILGNALKKFEMDFAKYTGSNYCFGVGNGLDALVLILKALQIQKNDEVIVPAHTFIATWLAVSNVGAKIVPVEPDETFNMSGKFLENYITSKTKAIIPVHLYGRPADMLLINAIAKKHDLFVIEDAAQAQGSSYHNLKCGNLADVAAFSFYPTKNLGAFGDAGAVTTNNKKIAEKISKLRNYGSTQKYVHEIQGVNSRMDEVQAAVLSTKLKYLDQTNIIKSKIADRYLSEISNPNIELPKPKAAESYIAWHQFVLKVKNRNNFNGYMIENGIGTMIHYPIPPHKSDAYFSEFKNQSFPITSKFCKEVISIPIYSSLNENEVDFIIKTINNYEQ